MIISVIIPAFNHLEDILICLNSLQALAADNPRIQYLIQDDASPDYDLRRLIPPYVAQVDRNPLNLGFAGNANMGARRAQGDILFFINQDIFGVDPLSRGWDDHLRAAFADESTGVVGARLLFEDGKIQSAGGEFDANCTPVHRCLGYSNLDHWEINEPREVSWTTGAAFAIRKELFEQVGGFDEAYIGGYFEDVELSLRVRELGHKILYTPTVTFVHKVGTSGCNTHFADNAKLFRDRWVLTRKVQPENPVSVVRYW